MTWAAVAAAAAVAGTALAGYNQYQGNKYQEKQAEADAKAVQAKGRLEAERIRKEKTKAQSAARAAAAENGLDVKEGTAIVINDEIEKAGNYDANMAEITGYNSSQRLKGEANLYGKNANITAVTGVLDSISVGAKGYSNIQKNKSNTALSANVQSAKNTGSGGWK